MTYKKKRGRERERNERVENAINAVEYWSKLPILSASWDLAKRINNVAKWVASDYKDFY